MKQKIKCESCNKVIAVGVKPAVIEIKCPQCGALNDLSKPVDQRSFTERLALEKK
jgi:phage FluMu protein Com